MHSQTVCRGCRTLLCYPAGAASVQCVACSTVTPVYPQEENSGAGMDRIVCGRCRTPLMYDRGATSVRCACCHAVTPVTRESSTSLVNCGRCRIMLMFPRGARSVRCSRCDFVTNVTSGAGSIPIAGPRSAENAQASTQANSMTVVVENPMTLDEKGKLVSNVAVGIASGKK